MRSLPREPSELKSDHGIIGLTRGYITLVSLEDFEYLNNFKWHCRDTLDNRRENLRLVTHGENMLNTERHDNQIGVMYHAASNSWLAYLNYPGKVVSLRYWPSKEIALGVVAKAKELQKEFPEIHAIKKAWAIALTGRIPTREDIY